MKKVKVFFQNVSRNTLFFAWPRHKIVFTYRHIEIALDTKPILFAIEILLEV